MHKSTKNIEKSTLIAPQKIYFQLTKLKFQLDF